MIKKVLSIVIILSMILHCSSRLGVISFLYENRFEIAHSIGLTSDKHITTCDSHYFNDRELKITDADAKTNLPMNLTMAQEINLFHVFSAPLRLNIHSGKVIEVNFPAPTALYSSYSTVIFHPPLS